MHCRSRASTFDCYLIVHLQNENMSSLHHIIERFQTSQFRQRFYIEDCVWEVYCRRVKKRSRFTHRHSGSAGASPSHEIETVDYFNGLYPEPADDGIDVIHFIHDRRSFSSCLIARKAEGFTVTPFLKAQKAAFSWRAIHAKSGSCTNAGRAFADPVPGETTE